MKTSKALIENNKYIIQIYQRYPIEIIRGDGSFIWDSKGKKYLVLSGEERIEYK